jgi:hypothetical protein
MSAFGQSGFLLENPIKQRSESRAAAALIQLMSAAFTRQRAIH